MLITGGTDLSAGSVVGFGGIVCAKLLISGVPIALSVLAGLTAGAVAGFINGLIITKLGVVPFPVFIVIVFAIVFGIILAKQDLEDVCLPLVPMKKTARLSEIDVVKPKSPHMSSAGRLPVLPVCCWPTGWHPPN